MQIPVLVESLGSDSFRAQTSLPLTVTADGKSSAEAVENLRAKIVESVSHGKQIVALDLPVQHPWTPFIGQFENDPLYEQWQQAIADNRRQRAADDDQ